MKSKKSYKLLLNTDDVCSIIKACGEHKVAELKFGGLYLKFDNPTGVMVGKDFQISQSVPQSHPDTEISERQAKQIEQEVIAVAEIQTKEDRLAQMMLEDPAEYERLLQSGELEDNAQA